MDVMTAIKNRRSIRKFEAKPVEDEKLLKVLEAGRLAPSACNGQPWKFIVVRNEETRMKLAEASGKQRFIQEAPVIIVACGTDLKSQMLCGLHRYLVDVVIAFSYMTLVAEEQGLGTCWIGAFEEPKVRAILQAPPDVRVVALMPLGYPGEAPGERPNKQLEEVVCYEKYQ